MKENEHCYHLLNIFSASGIVLKDINEDNDIYFIIFSRTLVFLVKDRHKGFRENDRCVAIFK